MQDWNDIRKTLTAADLNPQTNNNDSKKIDYFKTAITVSPPTGLSFRFTQISASNGR